MITSIDLVDACQYENTTVSLDSPVVAITGNSGCGKSNLINLVYYALSGDSGRIGGSGANRLGGGVGSVSVQIRTAAETANIYRRLPQAAGPKRQGGLGQKLELINSSGTSQLTDAGVVKAEISRLMGVSVDALGDFVFVAQGKLNAVVDATPTVRYSAVSSLIGVDRAVDIWEMLRDHERPPALPDVAGLSAVRARCAETQIALISAEKALQELPSDADIIATLEKATSVLKIKEHWDRLKRVRNELSAADTKIKALNVEIADLKTQLSAAESQHALCLSMLAWIHFENAQTANAKRAQDIVYLRASLQVANDKLKHQLIAPEPNDRLNTLRARRELNEKLAACTSNAACPTCGSTDGNLTIKVETARAEIAEQRQLEQMLSGALAEYAVKNKQRQADVRDRDLMSFKLQELQSSREVVAEEPKYTKPNDYAALAAQGYEAWRKAEFECATKASQIKGKLHKQQQEVDKLEQLKEGLKKTQPHLNAAEPTQSEIDSATLAINSTNQLQHRKTALISEIKTRRHFLQQEEQVLESLEAAQKNLAAESAWADRCNRVRQVFHRDAAPAAAITAYLNSVCGSVNEWLGVLSADFRVSVSTDCSFTAEFGGSRNFPVDRLSGGQKAVLSWAWRAAVQDATSDKLWLLCLDEPTYGLDDIRISALRLAVAGWRSQSGAQQLIIVTHDRRLADACDLVVDLGK